MFRSVSEFRQFICDQIREPLAVRFDRHNAAIVALNNDGRLCGMSFRVFPAPSRLILRPYAGGISYTICEKDFGLFVLEVLSQRFVDLKRTQTSLPLPIVEKFSMKEVTEFFVSSKTSIHLLEDLDAKPTLSLTASMFLDCLRKKELDVFHSIDHQFGRFAVNGFDVSYFQLDGIVSCFGCTAALEASYDTLACDLTFFDALGERINRKE